MKYTFTLPIQPFWTKEQVPQFIQKTSTEYCKVKHSELEGRDIKNRLFTSLISGLPDGCFIAGGFMVSLLLGDKNAKDIDIFCSSDKAFADVCNLLVDPPDNEDNELWAYQGYTLDTDLSNFENESNKFRYIKFKHDKRPSIQVLKLYWYDSPEHCIDTFDLTVTQIAADKNFIYLNPLTPFDLAKKKLVLHRMQFPASTIRRIIKYAGKGFYACPGSLVNIATAIQSHEGPKDINEGDFVYLD